MQAVRLDITPEILNLIAEIDEFKGGWKAYLFEASSPFETSLQMQELVEWTNQAIVVCLALKT